MDHRCVIATFKDNPESQWGGGIFLMGRAAESTPSHLFCGMRSGLVYADLGSGLEGKKWENWRQEDRGM